MNRLVKAVDECGQTTTYNYDAFGRLITTIYPDGATEHKEYDILDRVIKKTDGNGFETRTEYNFRGQPTALFYSDGTEEHFTYNPNGTLAEQIDKNQTHTHYHYDIFLHPIKTEIYNLLGEKLKTTTATYTPFCKLSATDPEGATTNYCYDFAGRMLTKQLAEQVSSYQYDTLGRLSHTQEDNVITSNLYDVKEQLLAKSIHDPDNEYFKETYTYDEVGNRTSITTCAGISHTEYNSLGEPLQTTDPLGNRTDITYSYGDCFIKTTTNPKGVQTLTIHDSRSRVVDLQVKNPSGQIIQRREKKYDLAGNQTHAIEHVYEGPNLRETIIHEWIYGSGGRIEKSIEAGQKVTQYFYDASGRLKTLIKPDGSALHREYDTLGRLFRYHAAGIDYTYTYDRKDRLLKVEDKILNKTTHRSYDIYDNLTQETLASGLTIRSHYDPYGKRVALYLPDGSEVTYKYQGPYLYSVSRKGYTHTYSERNKAAKPTLITLPNNSGTISITWDPLLRWEELHAPHYTANYT